MVTIANLNIYPIKSTQGIALTNANVLKSGFMYDRILMVSEPDGTFLTAREYPKLLTLKTEIIDDTIRLTYLSPHQQSIIINFSDFSFIQEPTEVWGSRFISHIAPIKVNRFLSDFLQKDVQLRWIGERTTRTIKRYPTVPLNFADGYPFSLLNLASFNYLQTRCPTKLDINQFRGNIIIDGALPFAEDGWKVIKIGDIIFDLVKPISRCVMITMNVKDGQKQLENEPLKTLGQFRRDEQGEIDFGINMIARNQGTISPHDRVEILEYKSPKKYLKNGDNHYQENHTDERKSVRISFEDYSFEGDNQQTILEQLEAANIRIPYSCRAGICGRCQLHLLSGEVSALVQTAIKPNQTILTCSCIPKGDISLARKKA